MLNAARAAPARAVGPVAPVTPRRSPVPTSTELATAFDGHLSPVRTSLAYRLSISAVLVGTVLLPVGYLAMIAAAAAGVAWYAVHATVLFTDLSGGLGGFAGRLWALAAVAYVAPLLAGGLVVLFMVLPLFGRRPKVLRPMWVDRREQPLLYAYVEKLCDAMGAPRPVRIDLLPSAQASAHIDNGLFGLVNRKLVLTIGLPLAACFDLRQFTAVLAHEFGHFAQGGSMRAGFAVHRINRWFMRLAYGRTAADGVVRAIGLSAASGFIVVLIALTCQAALSLARLALKGMAIAGHAASMTLSRQAEFDADRQAARIVGSGAAAAALQAVPFVNAAAELALAKANAGWKAKRLPDDLVALTRALTLAMPADARDKITANLLNRDARWFDTHPPLYQRAAVLIKAAIPGVLTLDAPATCLFRDFDELCKLTTISCYQLSLGDKLQPEHLVPTVVPAASPLPSVKTTRK